MPMHITAETAKQCHGSATKMASIMQKAHKIESVELNRCKKVIPKRKIVSFLIALHSTATDQKYMNTIVLLVHWWACYFYITFFIVSYNSIKYAFN